MTNKEWMATLTSEELFGLLDWLYHDYGKQYTNTRWAIIKWFDEEHQ